jgi:hypothetical protein
MLMNIPDIRYAPQGVPCSALPEARRGEARRGKGLTVWFKGTFLCVNECPGRMQGRVRVAIQVPDRVPDQGGRSRGMHVIRRYRPTARNVAPNSLYCMEYRVPSISAMFHTAARS